MKLFSIGKTEIKASFSMLICFALWIATANTVTMLFTVLCVLIHEAAHTITARLLGFESTEITLYPFGGASVIEGMDPAREIIVAAIGPLVSIAMGFAFSSSKVLNELSSISYAVAVFNLMPVYPLDGGRIIFSAFSVLFANRIPKAIRFISVFIALLFFSYSILRLALFNDSAYTVMAVFVLLASLKKPKIAFRPDKRKQIISKSNGVKLIKVPCTTAKNDMLKMISGTQYHIFIITDDEKAVRVLDEVALFEDIMKKQPAV